MGIPARMTQTTSGRASSGPVPDVALLGNSGLEIKPGCGYPAYYRFLEIRFRKKDNGRGTQTTPTTSSERSAFCLLGRFEERVAAGFMRGRLGSGEPCTAQS